MASSSADNGGAGGTSLASYDTLFTHHKAGMKDEDREKIKRIVYEMSKDSPFFKEQERRDQRVGEHIAACRARLARLGAAELAAHQQRADRIIANLDGSRQLGRLWCCVDMDAFFAACEALEDPSLRGDVPFAVGGLSMISTASYAARRIGVRSAMPGFIAQRLAREAGIHLRFVPGDHAKYARYAEMSRAAFRQFDAAFLPMSCDEAFLDLTDYCHRHAVDAAEAARRLRAAVLQSTGGLTCSVGVAPSRLLAKIASDVNKPNGQHIIPSERSAVGAFLAPLPLRKLPGIGRVADRVLREVLEADTCAALLERRAALCALFTPREATSYLTSALGIGGETPPPPPAAGEPLQKGISQERTFEPVGHEARLRQWCSELAQRLEEQMAAKGLQGRTLTLKLKTDSFRKTDRTCSVPSHFGHGSAVRIEPIALARLDEQLRANRAAVSGQAGSVRYRLMGLRATNLRLASEASTGGPLATFLRRGRPAVAAPESASAEPAGAAGPAAEQQQEGQIVIDDDAEEEEEEQEAAAAAEEEEAAAGAEEVAGVVRPGLALVWGGAATDAGGAAERGVGIGRDRMEGAVHRDVWAGDACMVPAKRQRVGELCKMPHAGASEDFDGAAAAADTNTNTSPYAYADPRTHLRTDANDADTDTEGGGGMLPDTLSQEARMLDEAITLSRLEAEEAAAWEALSQETPAAVAALQPVPPLPLPPPFPPSPVDTSEQRVHAPPLPMWAAEHEPAAAAASTSMEMEETRQWACGACTLLNPIDASRCAVCDCMRGGHLPAATTLAAQGDRPASGRGTGRSPVKPRGRGGASASGRGGGRRGGGKAPATSSIASFLSRRRAS